jgi:DNA-binding transcriptional ArsR family regulator
MTTTDPNYRRIADLMKQAADPTRLEMLAFVADADRFIGEIGDAFPAISRSGLSHHVAQMKHCGLVEPKRQGQRMAYAITNRGRRLLAAAQSMAE